MAKNQIGNYSKNHKILDSPEANQVNVPKAIDNNKDLDNNKVLIQQKLVDLI